MPDANSSGRTQSPETAYYENEALWATDFTADVQERARLEAVRALIPDEVESILDVGCGNGAFVNSISDDYRRVCGVDRSEAALNFVGTESIRAGADSLPFSHEEFDLVTSMEVIEHLPQPVFREALKEIARVARRWILVTVPYQEDTRLGLVRCPKCLCEFNRSYHLRRFDDEAMRGLFRGLRLEFELHTLTSVGSAPRYFGLYAAKRAAAPLRNSDLPAGVACPQCAYFKPAATSDYTASGARTSQGALGRFKGLWPHVRHPRWYLALFERTLA